MYVLILSILIFGWIECLNGQPSLKRVLEYGIVAEEDYQALYELYNATNGPHWDWRNLSVGSVPWQFETPADPCLDSWQGVECVTLGAYPDNTSYVSVLDLRNRNLTGTLPKGIGVLQQLEIFVISRNQVSGTIPQEVGEITNLVHFIADYNKLTGPLPGGLGGLAKLRVLIFSYNHISGPIPDMFCSMEHIFILYIDHNKLEGTVPAQFASMSNLGYLDFDENRLTGVLPDAFYNLTRLFFLGMAHNYFTGTISEQIGNLRRMEFLYLSDNYLTGTIPSAIGAMPILLFLHLFDNYLTGTIPAGADLGTPSYLEYLYLHNNMLTGTVPTTISRLNNVASLLLQDNRLTGTLDGVFNSSVQTHLTTIQLSKNRFSGEIPLEIFLLPKLATLVVVSNCFHGTLSERICGSKHLATLVMDGLHAAPSCEGVEIAGFSIRTDAETIFRGSIPSCLFQLPFLTTLHLAGNYLTGSLPSDLEIAEHLLDLDLSHNYIYGDIPGAIQKKLWYNLDLSYNRLSGRMNSDFYSERRNFTFETKFEDSIMNITFPASSAALNLQNNRLSGRIPNSVKSLHNISILDGNLFSCSLEKSNLPAHDTNERTYQCASNAFDVPYYAWLALSLVVLAILLLAWYWRSPLDQYLGIFDLMTVCQKWLNMITIENGLPSTINVRLQNIVYVNQVCDAIVRVIVLSISYILLVLMPLYAIVSVYYSTHSQQYTYTVSSTFQSGIVPFALEFSLLMVFMTAVGASFAYYMQGINRVRVETQRHFSEELSIPGERPLTRTARQKYVNEKRLQKLTVRFAFFAINVVVVVGVNIAFVYVAIYQSTVLLVLAQVLLSFFKFLWNTVCNPFLIRWTSHKLTSARENISHSSHSSHESGFFILQLFVSLVNNIAIPCLVVGAVDPSCFYNAIVSADSETSHYIYAECKLYTILGCQIVEPKIASAAYQPAFSYSYQCSSSFVTYYAPTFVYVCFVATFIAPIAQLVAQRLHLWLPRGSYAFRVIDFCIPRVLKPVEKGDITRNIFKPFFDGNLVLVTLLTYLGIMMTFGAVFPPLAAAIAVTVLSVAYFAKLKIGRLLTSVVKEGSFNYLDIIELECKGVGSVTKLQQSVWMLIAFSCVFYTVFLFDTLGNAVGFVGAVWVVFVVPFMPLCAYIGINVWTRYTRRNSSILVEPTGESCDVRARHTEMRSIGSPGKNQTKQISRSNKDNESNEVEEYDEERSVSSKVSISLESEDNDGGVKNVIHTNNV